MKSRSLSWLAGTTLTLVLAGSLMAQQGGGGGGGGGEEDEGLGNNLGTPAVFAEGYGVSGLLTSVDPGIRPALTETNPTLPYFDSSAVYMLDGTAYYPQQTASTWRAQIADGAPEGEPVIVNWSDNLLNTRWTSRSVIRVETVMYQNLATPMTGYTMQYLQGEGTSELWGADTTTYDSVYRTVFSAGARLKIEKITGPNGTVIPDTQSVNLGTAEGFGKDGPGYYGAEINVSGNLIFGYNWTLQQWAGTEAEKAGWYRLTFSIDPSVAYSIASEEGTTASYAYDSKVTFAGLDPSDTAAEALFKAKLPDTMTSVVEIEILADKTGGSPTMPLVVALTGTGKGSVTSDPAGIDCGTDCSENYARNTVVALTATPGPGSEFTAWGGDADCADGSVTMEGGRYCEAQFDKRSAISTDKSSLTFVTALDGTTVKGKSPSQTVNLVAGPGTTNAVEWTAISDQPWLVVWPASGSGVGSFNVDAFAPSASVAGSELTATISVLLTGAENSITTVPVTLELIPAPSDLNTDNQPDLVWRNIADGRIAVWNMQGTTMLAGTYTDPSAVPDLDWEIRASGDFNNDGKPDLVWQNKATGALSAWFFNDLTRIGTASLTTLMNGGTEPDLDWKIVGTGDMDRDGQLDLIWQHATAGDLRIWHMTGTTQIDEMPLALNVGGTDWHVVGVADMNGDTYPDFVWHNAASGGIAAWLMADSQILSADYLTPADVSDTTWRIVGARDMNNDGRADLVWQNRASGYLAVWLMNGLSEVSGFFLSPEMISDLDWRIVSVR